MSYTTRRMNLSTGHPDLIEDICSASFPLIVVGRVVLAIWNSFIASSPRRSQRLLEIAAFEGILTVVPDLENPR
jgi:hypothetical protein